MESGNSGRSVFGSGTLRLRECCCCVCDVVGCHLLLECDTCNCPEWLNCGPILTVSGLLHAAQRHHTHSDNRLGLQPGGSFDTRTPAHMSHTHEASSHACSSQHTKRAHPRLEHQLPLRLSPTNSSPCVHILGGTHTSCTKLLFMQASG